MLKNIITEHELVLKVVKNTLQGNYHLCQPATFENPVHMNK